MLQRSTKENFGPLNCLYFKSDHSPNKFQINSKFNRINPSVLCDVFIHRQKVAFIYIDKSISKMSNISAEGAYIDKDDDAVKMELLVWWAI